MISRICSVLGMLSFINGSAQHLQQTRRFSGKVGSMAFCTRGVLDMELGMHVGASSGVLWLNTLTQDPVPACVEKKMK